MMRALLRFSTSKGHILQKFFISLKQRDEERLKKKSKP